LAPKSKKWENYSCMGFINRIGNVYTVRFRWGFKLGNIFVLFFKAVSIIFKYPEYLLDLKSTNYISLFQVQGHVLEGGKSY